MGVHEGVIYRMPIMLMLKYQYIAQSKEPSLFIILDLRIPSIVRRIHEVVSGPEVYTASLMSL
jgi:hypothetical protein